MLETSAFVFATDLAGEGVETVLDNLERRGGLGGVTPAFVYHAARDVFPHNPAHRVVLQERGALFFPPEPGLYATGLVQPSVSSLARSVTCWGRRVGPQQRATSPCTPGPSSCTPTVPATTRPAHRRMRSAISTRAISARRTPTREPTHGHSPPTSPATRSRRSSPNLSTTTASSTATTTSAISSRSTRLLASCSGSVSASIASRQRAAAASTRHESTKSSARSSSALSPRR